EAEGRGAIFGRRRVAWAGPLVQLLAAVADLDDDADRCAVATAGADRLPDVHRIVHRIRAADDLRAPGFELFLALGLDRLERRCAERRHRINVRGGGQQERPGEVALDHWI